MLACRRCIGGPLTACHGKWSSPWSAILWLGLAALWSVLCSVTQASPYWSRICFWWASLLSPLFGSVFIGCSAGTTSKLHACSRWHFKRRPRKILPVWDDISFACSRWNTLWCSFYYWLWSSWYWKLETESHKYGPSAGSASTQQRWLRWCWHRCSHSGTFTSTPKRSST